MRDKIFYVCGVLMLVAAVILIVNSALIPKKISTNRISNALDEADNTEYLERNNDINRIYDQNYIASKMKIDSMSCYVPKYTSYLHDDAYYYAEIFNVLDMYYEDEINSIFESFGGKLTINKHYDYMRYESYEIYETETNEKLSPISVISAIEVAGNFIREKNLTLEYTDTEVTVENNKYIIEFIGKLDGVKNYAFNTTVELDLYGNIKVLDYYGLEYEKLITSRVKTMSEAFYELPIEGYEEILVDLKSCELVYFYEDSIIQPGYLFLGEIVEGGEFSYFVKAAKY